MIGLFGIFQDVTEQVKEQRDEFYQDMARTVGHCLGNWMGTLEANLMLLTEDVASTPALERLREAISFLRHFSKIASGFATIGQNIQFSEVSIPRLLERCVGLLVDNRIHVCAPGPELVITGSEFHLQLAVTELLTNATRFALSRIEVWHERRSGEYQIHVQDDGPGVVARLIEGDAMFNAQTSTDEASHTGLGLAYVKRVAQIHDGKVEYVRSPGQGAHFVLCLPEHPTEAGQQ